MKLKTWIGLSLAFCLLGCSSDNELPSDSSESNRASFIAVGEDLDKVYQYSYDGTTDTGITSDLTNELGILPTYLTLRQQEELLSFYTFSDGLFSLALKDLSNGITETYPDFYTNVAERSVTWGTNSRTKVFFGYFGPAGSRNLGVLELDFMGPGAKDIVIAFAVEATFQPLFHNGILYVSFRDNLGNYKLAAFDSNTGGVTNTLDFGPTPYSFLISKDGELAIFKNEPESILERYDTTNLSFLDSKTLSRNFTFPAGPIFDAFLVDEKIYFNLSYPQPSQFSSGPAIYDIEKQELELLDLFSLVNEVEQQLGQSVQITTQVYHQPDEVFLIGYATFGDEILGGVIQASKEGELLGNTTFPFFPNYFVRN